MAAEQPDRRHQIVMGLGIVTILLLSANLITAITNQIWPKTSPEYVVHELNDVSHEFESHITFYNHPHRTVEIRRTATVPNVHFEIAINRDLERSLEQELADLERAIEVQLRGQTSELAIELERLDRKLGNRHR